MKITFRQKIAESLAAGDPLEQRQNCVGVAEA